MSLLAPIGLAALVALPLIIVLHMRHITPPRRPVPSLRFWEAANPRPAEERRLRRPPLTLPLALQLVAAALLAFALARPATAAQLAALAPGLHAEPRHVIILLDGSTSMSALAGSPPLSRWDSARQETVARLAPLREGDVATLIVMATRPQTYTATDDASLIDLRERLTTMPQPGGRADLDAALTLAGDLFLPNLERQIVVISDGAVTADAAVAGRASAPIELVIAGGSGNESQQSNVAVTDIAARPNPDGNGTIGLYAAVTNFGPQAVTVPVTLIGDGLEIGHSDVTLDAAGGSSPLNWILPPGVADVTVRIDQSDALVADNSAMLLPGEAATATIAPRVLLVSDLPGVLARALMALNNIQVSIEPSENTSAIAAGGYDLVVFDRTAPTAEVVSEIETASLWVAPPVGGPFATGEGVSDPKVTRVRAGDPLLEGVDLSGATFGPTPNFMLAAGDEEVVGSADGPLLYRSEVNGQPAVVLATDPEASNLPKRVAFPVLIANIVGALAPDGIPAAVPLGEPLVYEPRAATASVQVTAPSGEVASLPVSPMADRAAPTSVSRQIIYTDTGSPGIYAVSEADDAGFELGPTRFVVNAGHPRESDLRGNANLGATLATSVSTGTVAPRQDRVDLWPLLAVAALGVIAVEWIVGLRPARRRRSLETAGASS